jgi:hypothetical protein
VGGRPLVRWNDYRTSTRSDAVDAIRFGDDGEKVTFRMLGQQAMLARTTLFGYTEKHCTGEAEVPVLRSGPEHNGFWLSRDGGPAIQCWLPWNTRRFFLHETSGNPVLGARSFRPRNKARSEDASRLLVLPALSGGTWVEDGNRAGHWEGSTRNEGYLLCWEDTSFDSDYQDMIVLVLGVQSLRR